MSGALHVAATSLGKRDSPSYPDNGETEVLWVQPLAEGNQCKETVWGTAGSTQSRARSPMLLLSLSDLSIMKNFLGQAGLIQRGSLAFLVFSQTHISDKQVRS